MKPIPVILDVDTGVDDAVAITLAARCRSIKLLGLVASFGNRPLHYTLRNTLWLKASRFPSLRLAFVLC